MYKEYPYPIDDETAQLIANELNFAVMDPNKRKILEIEREAYRVINVNRAETEEINKELMAAMSEKNKELEEKDKAISEKNKELEDNAKALEKKNIAIEEKNKLIEELLLKLK